jgi:hypothetical protein
MGLRVDHSDDKKRLVYGTLDSEPLNAQLRVIVEQVFEPASQASLFVVTTVTAVQSRNHITFHLDPPSRSAGRNPPKTKCLWRRRPSSR